MRIVLAALLLTPSLSLNSSEPMPLPRFDSEDRLIRPEGYREWMFVGSNLGMGYKDGKPDREPTFHYIYMQREAYQHYKDKGEFPDKTMLVMEVLTRGTNASINKQGQFSDQSRGIEVALKDTTRFPEKWAYFNFISGDPGGLKAAKPFAKDACWSCHNEHGQVDNVFVQFYPVLRDARPLP
jgi:hypothetical protein